jgi:hypothetical protein
LRFTNAYILPALGTNMLNILTRIEAKTTETSAKEW